MQTDRQGHSYGHTHENTYRNVGTHRPNDTPGNRHMETHGHPRTHRGTGLGPPSRSHVWAAAAGRLVGLTWGPGGAEVRGPASLPNSGLGPAPPHTAGGLQRGGRRYSLIEVCLGDGEEAAVPVGLDGEDEGLPGEHGQLAHHLPGARDEQAAVLVAVDLPLVHVQQPRDDKQDVHVLAEGAQPGQACFLTIGALSSVPPAVVASLSITGDSLWEAPGRELGLRCTNRPACLFNCPSQTCDA